MGQQGAPFLSNYNITDKLSKLELFMKIKKREHLLKFIPDSSSGTDVPRDFMLSVITFILDFIGYF